MSSQISRGAAFDRSRLKAEKLLLQPDIVFQFSGAEMMDSRQYRHT
jgi:hypothetical protein